MDDITEFHVLAGIMVGDIKPFAELLKTGVSDFSFLSRAGTDYHIILAEMLEGKTNSIGVVYQKKYSGNKKKTQAYKNERIRENIRIGKTLKSEGIDLNTNMRVFDNVRSKHIDINLKDRALENIKKLYETHLKEQKEKDEQFSENVNQFNQQMEFFSEIRKELEALRTLKASKPYPEISEELDERMSILEKKLSDTVRNQEGS